MTEAENLARLSAAATKEADDIRYYSGGSSYNASEAKYHAELARLYRSGRLVMLPSVEEMAEALRTKSLNDFPYSTRLSAATSIHNHLKGTSDAN